jgi:formylglycine-generating enzyme required for sulfatase activity
VGRFPVTRGDFSTFVKETNYKTGTCLGAQERSWLSPGFEQDDRHPVVCVSWDDAKAYGAWISKVTSKPYRLLSEAEREYVTRAGTTTPFWWGPSISTAQANYNGNYVYGAGSKGEYRQTTVPVGTFTANPWGLYNVHGNVWDWTEDCWHESYQGAPADGSAWTTGGDCSRRVRRGGSFSYGGPAYLRAASRNWGTTPARFNDFGFRVARTLE